METRGGRIILVRFFLNFYSVSIFIRIFAICNLCPKNRDIYHIINIPNCKIDNYRNMKIKNTLGAFLLIGILCLMAACKSSAPTVDPAAMLNYCKEQNDATTESLSKAYGSVINKSRKTGLKQPGIYSDYAVTLVKQGKRAEANSWFNKEIEAFPASRAYVTNLKRMLIPEYINNNSVNVNEASVEDDSEEPENNKSTDDKGKGKTNTKKNSKH